MNPLLRKPRRYRSRFPAKPENWYVVTFTVTTYIDPTDEILVEEVRQLRGGTLEKVVRDEVQSNLESVSYVRQVVVCQQSIEEQKTMTVKFFPNDKGNPAGKLADAELHFSGGPLDGLKLIGFAIWERKGGSRNVTFPARQYSVNGERRSYALLRPAADAASQDHLRDVILGAYSAHQTALTA